MKKKLFLALFFGAVVLSAASGWYFFTRQAPFSDPYRATLKEASREGEKKARKLLIQIAPGGEGRFERGDIILLAEEDKEFSLAEKEGFLIIKVFLTEKQQQLLLLSMRGEKEDESGRPVDIKRRKFTVDLEKIGIAPDDIKGKIISDKVFEDEVLIEKEN